MEGGITESHDFAPTFPKPSADFQIVLKHPPRCQNNVRGKALNLLHHLAHCQILAELQQVRSGFVDDLLIKRRLARRLTANKADLYSVVLDRLPKASGEETAETGMK